MFVNFNSTLGIVYTYAIENVTGSEFFNILLILLVLYVCAIALGLPMEYATPIIFPCVLIAMAFFQEWLLFGGLIIFYLAWLLAKNFLFK